MQKLIVVTVAALTALTPAPALAAPPRLEASLRSHEVEVGEPTVLDVTISGAANPRVHVPQVATLDIVPLGTSQQTRIVNGAVSRSITRHYRVVPRRAGRFAIGPITADGASAPAVDLSVRPAGARSSARGARTPPHAVRAEPAGRRALLRVRIPKRRLVVGESVPITIRAYVKAGTAGTIEGVPQLESDAFAVHDLLDQAQQGQTEIRGTRYATLTWRGRLTALLPGEPRLKATLPVTLRWREIVRDERPGGSLRDRFQSMFDRFLDDPFFDDPLAASSPLASGSLFRTSLGPERSADVVLEHDLGAVHVTEPPREGRPDDYGGAVGRFTMHAEATPERVRAGEPFTVRLTVEGEGTFERVTHGLFDDDARYRVYPATSRFTARSGGHGERGEKVFEQSIVPLAPGALDLGALRFSYYDPRRGRYVTRTSDPVHVEVDPAPGGAMPVHDLDDAAQPPDGGLAPNYVAPGRFVERLWPLPRASLWLIACCFVMSLAVGGGVALARRDPALARIRRARKRVARELAAARRRMRAQARRGDGPAFYAAARAYAQRAIGAAFDLAPEAVTLAEADARLERVPDAVREVLERADAIAFAGASPDTTDLRATCERVERALEEIAAR